MAERLRAARAAGGLTQEAAAEALSVSRETVARWETGVRKPLGLARRFLEAWIDGALGKEGDRG